MVNTNEFKNYLIEKGYSEFTKSGRRSTVYDYDFRVKRVCRAEQLSVKDLVDKVESFILDYSSTGIKWELGRLSHESVINALKAFKHLYLLSNNKFSIPYCVFLCLRILYHNHYDQYNQ